MRSLSRFRNLSWAADFGWRSYHCFSGIPFHGRATARLVWALSLFFPLWSALISTAPAAEPAGEDGPDPSISFNQPWFIFDQPDEVVPSVMLESPLAYDANVARGKEGLWVSWLEFEPGKGDQLWVGLRGNDGWVSKQQLSATPRDYANPTPTVDAAGELWITYEGTNAQGNWQIFALHREGDGKFGAAVQVSEHEGPNISHRAAANPKGGITLAWQDGNGGIFQVVSRGITTRSMTWPMILSSTPLNSWAPSVGVGTDGRVHLAWDAFDGESYNVFAQSFKQARPRGSLDDLVKAMDEGLSPPLPVANTKNFEAHAQVACGKDGKVWLLWEEDGENWGKHYIAREPGKRDSTKMTDKIGPLHRYRRLRFGELREKDSSLREYEIPQPAFDLARQRTNAPPELKDFGAFYENGRLAVDGLDRPWIVYRHFYVPWIGIIPAHHHQENMRIYARCLTPQGWSKLYSFKEGQGDGGQRTSVSPEPDGIAVAWAVGRTDRRKTKDPHGVALAQIHLAKAEARLPAPTHERKLDGREVRFSDSRHPRPETEVAGKRYELWYGDLHRHTDISLCFCPVDGTIDDAYRYAIDAAPLDFLGITDHTHDLDMGQQLAHIWWRSRKEVNRHLLGTTFIPFFSYERSRGDTDHNVISLRDDMLRPHTYPLPQFWKELDTDTFTIPHQPFNLVLWKHKDDVHRPLLEIYQGMRNNIRESDAQAGLESGHHFGIIASSDHLSTGASFACVWSEKPNREAIFRSMQARRTFGATAKIMLKVTAGEHWMGESFSVTRMPEINIEARGTDSIAKVEIEVDGKAAKTFDCSGRDQKLAYQPEGSLTGQHIFFVKLEQQDGNHAWASPLWVEIK